MPPILPFPQNKIPQIHLFILGHLKPRPAGRGKQALHFNTLACAIFIYRLPTLPPKRVAYTAGKVDVLDSVILGKNAGYIHVSEALKMLGNQVVAVAAEVSDVVGTIFIGIVNAVDKVG